MMKVICLLRLTKALVIPQRWKYGRLQKKKEKQVSLTEAWQKTYKYREQTEGCQSGGRRGKVGEGEREIQASSYE